MDSYKTCPVRLLRRATDIREEEARRIATALHDETGQMLAIVRMRLDLLTASLPKEHTSGITEVQSILHAIQDQLRNLSHELRPPMLDEMGLSATLEFLTRNFALRVGFEIELQCSTTRRYPIAVETAVYRLVFEALTNACKYARATFISVRVWETRDTLLCEVRDNGVGFRLTNRDQTAGNGLGLIGITDRLHALNAAVEIRSSPGRGTVISAAIPVGIVASQKSGGRKTRQSSNRQVFRCPSTRSRG